MVEYHVNEGYSTTWGDARADFYNLSGTPSAWFDGALECVGAYGNDQSQYNWYLDQYNARRAVPTDVTITVTGVQVTGPTFTIRTRVALEAGGVAKNVRVYMVQVVDHYPNPPTYSHGTFRQAAATEDVALTPGQGQTVERNFTFDSVSWDRYTDIQIVVWAQQPSATSPAEVCQAAVMDWPFELDCNGNGVPDAQDIAEGTLPDANSNGVPDGCEVAPTITSHPANEMTCLGGTATFSAAASGYLAPTYQWRKGTTELVNGGNISGATSATLTISPVDPNDAGTDYNCVATNNAGTAFSDNAELTTTGASLTITSHPTDQIACIGGTAHFRVTADGCPTPTYQWRKGATNLVDGSNVSGATSATLTISPVASNDAATDYNCIVTNYAGPIVSDNAALATDGVAAAITAQPTSQIACLGGAAVFQVAATGYPAPTYRWRRGAVNLVDGGNISGATTATLTIDPAGPDDVNVYGYDVVVSNACNTTSSYLVNLTVVNGVSIGTQPETHSASIGAGTTFSVSATGTGTLHYRWRKNGIELFDSGTISGTATAVLSINPVARTDTGTYDVAVTDDCNTVTSAAATLWLAGDINCDGVINYGDINPFVLALKGASAYEAEFPNCRQLNADCNGDAAVNYGDINPFVILLATQ